MLYSVYKVYHQKIYTIRHKLEVVVLIYDYGGQLVVDPFSYLSAFLTFLKWIYNSCILLISLFEVWLFGCHCCLTYFLVDFNHFCSYLLLKFPVRYGSTELALEEKVIRQDWESGCRSRFWWITGREGILTDKSFVFALFTYHWCQTILASLFI